ncbi:metallophosphoesterase [Rhodocytophaga aerolata]|uniref:Metallophosphoesterase n=1 Tax=Rhodocytophaga aerolata TaxID=455078 RepID=A0ABT8RIG2_9BACT|nr:metallophosphoesterase [Rhodocytophaga aerolata]MDO1451149.1 metallophosphoesterase [Rhodocytophaga aerolata]
MVRSLFSLLVFLFVVLFIEWYVLQAVKNAEGVLSPGLRKTVVTLLWTLSLASVGSILLMVLVPAVRDAGTLRNFLISLIFINFMVKLFMTVFLFIDDFVRLIRWIAGQFTTTPVADTPQPGTGTNLIPRSEFLVKTAIIAGSLPVIGVGYGIIVGAHDYRIRRVTLNLPNLPKSFDGVKIGQLSDIHSGSFFNKTAVRGGVDMLMREKADVVFFTGDLVNNVAKEVADYMSIFRHVKAPMGVYSTLGNHDYGDYVQWPSIAAKKQNLLTLMEAHKELGWDLLMNENRILSQGGDTLAIIGIENYGARGNFAKYGKLAPAYEGTQEAPVKLLLSHDPSHWDAQVRTEYPDIDVMFAGHTHGMQFGVEVGNIKWSPVQYVYEQWAGLYQKGKQYLYVNRGFGYIGFPGRVGMPPEITIFTLKAV